MDIIVTAEENPDSYVMRLRSGEKKKVTVDYSTWAEVNEDIVSADIAGSYEDKVLVGNLLTFIVTDSGCVTVTVTTANLVGKLSIDVGRNCGCCDDYC